MTGNGGEPATRDVFFEDPPLTTSEAFADLAPEWAALHAEVPGASPFSHPAWLESWLEHFAPAASPVFIAARHGGQLAGVFPLDLSGPVARFAGDPEVIDFAPAIARSGSEAIAASGLVEWLMEDMTTALDAWGLPEESPLRPALAAGAARFSWKAGETDEGLAPTATLPGDWEAYLDTLPKKHRHELRRKLRHLDELGESVIAVESEPEAVAARVDQLLAMMHASRTDKDAFLTPTMEAYFRTLALKMAEAGFARLVTMTLGGQPAATLFTFETATTAYLYNSGYDPAHADHAIGLLSKALYLRDAQSRGLTTFDFLRGHERYKFHLGAHERRIVTVSLRQR